MIRVPQIKIQQCKVQIKDGQNQHNPFYFTVKYEAM